MSPAAVSASRRSGITGIALFFAVLAGTPDAAFAGHRDRCDDRPRHRDRDCDSGDRRRGSYSSFSISIGDCGSSLSYGALYGTRGVYRPPVCPPKPVVYCPPPVVVAPAYCPPPVIVRSEPVYVDRTVVVDRPVVVERPVVVSAPVPPAPVAPPPTSVQDRDLGTTYLRLGDLENAARLYQRYLAVYSNDAYAQRGMALVELGRGNALEGTRWMAAAYRGERSLAVSPPSPDGVGGTAVYQRMLDTAALHAGQARTP